MLSLEARPWQNRGAVSCALIKHSSFFVAPSSLLFSQKLQEQAAAKLQQSCQLDKNSPYISVTQQQGPSSSQAGGWGADELFLCLASVPREDPWFKIFPGVFVLVSLPECFRKDRWAQLARRWQLGWKKDKIKFQAMQLVAESPQAHNQVALFFLPIPSPTPAPPYQG